MQLSKVQAKFKDTMLDHPKVLDDLPQDFAGVFEEGGIPLPARLKVYRNNIVGSLTDLMLTTFPTIEKLAGKEFLEGMARSFILENPPSQGNLNTYGAGFAEFIEGFKPAGGLAYLPDIARLELAMNAAYYAPDDEPLSAEDLSGIPPEDLGDLSLNLRTSAHLISSRFPLTRIKAFCECEEEGSPPDMDDGGEHILVFRPALESIIITLPEEAYMMLDNLYKGNGLGTAVEKTMSQYPEFDLQGFLSAHLEFETFRALSANT